jgi:hypothetical protein
MIRKHILFATYYDRDLDEGISYAIDLAKTMEEDLTVLFVERQKKEQPGEVLSAPDDGKLASITGEGERSGVSLRVLSSPSDAVSGIEGYLKKESDVDMVLLSPGIKEEELVSRKALNKLLKAASRRVVTMSRHLQHQTRKTEGR